jgi:hypothetical protein
MATRLNIVALLMGLLITGTVASKQNAAIFGLCNICVRIYSYIYYNSSYMTSFSLLSGITKGFPNFPILLYQVPFLHYEGLALKAVFQSV